jgi:hypothetical protein
MLSLTGNLQVAYGAVFVVEIIGLLVALWALRRINVGAYRAGQETPADIAQVFAGAIE